MKIEDILRGLKDAQDKLSTKAAVANPGLISEQMYRLGQYAAALEEYLGDTEEQYEQDWAILYLKGLENKLSATAAKQAADVEMAHLKGAIKKLQRYVSAAWHVHMSCMARHKHLEAQMRGSV